MDPSGFFKVPWARGALAGSDGEPLNSANAVSRADNVQVETPPGTHRLERIEIVRNATQVQPRREVSGPQPSGSGVAVVAMNTTATSMRVGAAIERGARFLRAVVGSPAARGGGLGVGIAIGWELTAGAQRDPVTDSLVFNEMNTGNGENDAGQLTADGESQNERGSQGESTVDVLMPGGRPIGQAGTSEDIRVVPGDLPEAQELFDKATKGGKKIDKPGYPGTMVELPGGGTVGLRPKSKSGGPAIDVNVPNVPYDKIHFGPKK